MCKWPALLEQTLGLFRRSLSWGLTLSVLSPESVFLTVLPPPTIHRANRPFCDTELFREVARSKKVGRYLYVFRFTMVHEGGSVLE
jgi:hypothetical protein